MAILSLQGVSISYGGPSLLDRVDLTIEPRERICLVGRNGAGKSTLMKVIKGELKPDAGEIKQQQGICISRLQQDVPTGDSADVFSTVARGLGPLGQQVIDYHMALASQDTAALEKLQQEIDRQNGWDVESKINNLLTRLSLDGSRPLSKLSGGLQRRALLAQALISEPDLLLLDEPTNHLEVEAIEWLETFLLNFPSTLLFITHDRAFLKKLATRIIEIDRGKLTSWPGNYDRYLTGKEKALEEEAQQRALFDKKLSQEEAWIRQGIKARRTRNEGRVRQLQKLRQEHKARREQLGQARISAQNDNQSGKIVLQATHIDYQFHERKLIRDFNATLMRGDKVGIIGPNGVGKTTLINLLTERLQPTGGQVELGTKLTLAYFDQLRNQLDENKTVRDNVADGNETVQINGKEQHIISYLGDFLFEPSRANTPVRALSGGEKNRLLLARLFSQPSNFLILDEPTNDLDIETLEQLESLLTNYTGTVLLISHDRAFLDNVVTSTWVFEGDGQIREYIGGYEDWLRQREAPSAPEEKKAAKEKKEPDTRNHKPKVQKKLSYKDQRELDQLPERVDMLETQVHELQQQMTSPDFYKQEKSAITAAQEQIKALEQQLEAAYARWEALEDA
ncbi:MAG: ATP-binding cassette domain-containing protein [Gammaproteobacteria bacterium]|nr:ATP-binding cassette domain-containing protein [Gammaproteobacteria bacterium]